MNGTVRTCVESLCVLSLEICADFCLLFQIHVNPLAAVSEIFSPFLGHFCSCSRVLGSDTSMLGLGFLVLVADLCCLFYFGLFW